MANTSILLCKVIKKEKKEKKEKKRGT